MGQIYGFNRFHQNLVCTSLLHEAVLHRGLVNLRMLMRGPVERHYRHITLAPVRLKVILPRFVLLMAVIVGNHFSGCARYYTTRITQEELVYAVA
jgi:hypothetical protein